MSEINLPTKDQMRQQVLSLRDELSVEQRIDLSLQACELAASAIKFQPGCIVSGFWPIRSEIDPRPLMSSLQQMGARLCLPVVVDKQTIVFRELVRGAPLIKAGFGTVGPGPDAEVLNPSIMLVPLAAFDKHGGRLGYGAGHFDRAIEKLRISGLRPVLIGFGFDVQKVGKVPTETHDQKLDMIITENGVTSVNQ